MASRRFAGWIACAVFMVAVAALVVPVATAPAASGAQGASRADSRATAAGHARVAAGDASSYAIKPNGSLWAWGANGLGELGLGNTNGHGVGRARLQPQRVGQATSWRTLAAGSQFCLALRSDGSLWSWGANTLGALGIPAPPYGNHPRPARVGSAAWRVIGAGNEFSAGIRRDGSLWTWGSNFLGELGIGSTDANRWVPTRVGSETDWKTIAVGYDWVLALKNDGSLWAWGGNDGGQLGIGSSDSAPDNEHPGVPHLFGLGCHRAAKANAWLARRGGIVGSRSR
jgi:alpha-tubulin suppressor-like RCC1 family protein